MKKCICFIVLLALMTSSCGTFIPGPRYKVTVDDFTFNYDGSAVFYLEDSYRFFPLLVRYREKHYLYLYDRQSRKHRFVAETDAFSVSQLGPYVLYSPPWEKRFKNREYVPDFYLLNYATGDKKSFRMPESFDKGYISYGFARVQWGEDNSLIAFVNFRYAPGEQPSNWLRQKVKPSDWHTSVWRVSINPQQAEQLVKAVTTGVNELPNARWSEIRGEKFVSPDGDEELVFSKYNGYFSFNSQMVIVDKETGSREYVIKEHKLIGLTQAGKYILCYLFYAPLLELSELFFNKDASGKET